MASDWQPLTLPRQSVRVLTAADGQTYQLMLTMPSSPPPSQGWPAVLVLDGAAHFQIVAASAAALAQRPAKTGVSPMVVIGLAPSGGPGPDAARRTWDFTDGPPQAPATSAHAGGGAEAFVDLICGQALPAAFEQAAIDRSRLAIFCHSLGGLFGLKMMARSPDLFAAWLLVSPSLWWRPALAAEAVRALEGRRSHVFLAWGEREALSDREDRAMGPRAAQALEMFAGLLGADAVAGGVVADEDHGSTPIAAAPAALRLAGRAFS